MECGPFVNDEPWGPPVRLPPIVIDSDVTRPRMIQPQKVLEWAHTFVEEVRRDLEKASMEGSDLPPRLRLVNLRPGQMGPETRTLAVPVPPGGEGSSPEILSSLIARYVADKPSSCLLLALDVLAAGDGGEQQPLLIAEARDRGGTRLFLMQPFRVEKERVLWDEPLGGGWQDPGREEMILDAAFGKD